MFDRFPRLGLEDPGTQQLEGKLALALGSAVYHVRLMGGLDNRVSAAVGLVLNFEWDHAFHWMYETSAIAIPDHCRAVTKDILRELR